MSIGDPREAGVRPVRTVVIPAGMCRRCVRALSRRLRDVPGVVAFEVDAEAGRLHVTGDATAGAVRAAVGDVSGCC